MSRRLLPVTLALMLVLGGCSAPEPTPKPAESPRSANTPTPESTHTPRPTFTNTPKPTSSETSEPTETATLTSTPTETPTPTASATWTLTPTPTPIPEELRKDILNAYRTMVVIHVNSELLGETADRVQSGELSGIEEAMIILVLSGLIQAVENALPEFVPPEALSVYWANVVAVHEQTQDVMRRWLTQEILSPQVVGEMESVLALAENTLAAAEAGLAQGFGFDSILLTEQRQEVLRFVDELLGQ